MSNNHVAKAEPRKLSRIDVRDLIFTSAKAKSVIIQFFGADIELRQPSVGEIEEMHATGNGRSTMADMLVRYAFIPSTDEKVFEESDLDSIKQMPFGKEFSALTRAISQLTSIDIEGAEKN